MKKLLSLFICILTIFALSSCGGDTCSHRDEDDNSLCDKCGESYTDSLELKYTLNENGTEYSVGGIGSCTDADVIIHSIYAGLPVTSIGEWAFYNCNNLTSVVIPDSVTSIGDYAFSGCTSLTSVTIPDSVTSIGNNAFAGCDSLTSITVDTNNQHYKDIDGNLYSKDGKILIQYAIGKTDTSFTIPDSVTSIGSYAFRNCTSLTSVVIPDSVTIIGNEAFYDCDSLMSVTIGNGVTNIGNEAFYDCDSLMSVTIGNGVTNIGERAFYDCNSLTSVVIGNSVTSIGDYAFAGCFRLVEVANNSSLNIRAGSYYDYGKVASYAKDVHKGEIKGVVNVDGYLFYTYNGVHYLVGYIGADTELTLPDSYNGEKYVFNDYAFAYCDSLTSVVIPGGVTSIGNSAFSSCDKLTSVTIGNGVTNIGEDAFYDCSLTSVVIPDSVTSIGDYAFAGCDKLVEVINHSSLNITAGSSSYGGVGYYAKEVHKGESKIVNVGDYLFYTYNGVNYLLGYVGTSTSLILPENYNGENYEIYKYAFAYCDSLTSVTIPDSITSISDSAFSSCDSLTSVVIGNSVTSIGSYAFSSCDSLTSVVIGNSVTSIGEGAFYYCDSLTSVTIPDSVTIIGGKAFGYCSSLASIKYRGTQPQWNAILKGSDWDYITGNYTITYNYTGE